MRKFVAVLALVPILSLSCAGFQLTPDQIALLGECEAKVSAAATSEQCLGKIVSGSGTASAIAISCAIQVALQAIPACAAIIPSFLTVKAAPVGAIGASPFPEAADVQLTDTGKVIQAKVRKAMGN